MSQFDVLVIGAGFSGATVAERLASAGRSVLVIDERQHIGGNAYDEPDSHGVAVQRYGPHIFHTNSQRVVDYLSRFTDWRPYEHRVRASIKGKLYPFPINVDTLNMLYGLELDEEGAKQFLERASEKRDPIKNSEDVVVNAVGRELYELFFRGYTRKQWARDPSELAATVTARIPVRTNHDDRYFTDSFQEMPADGFTPLFRRMLDHPNIRVELGTDYLKEREKLTAKHTIFTGPIDAFFGHCFGPLPYRSLRFEHFHVADQPDTCQPVAVINYPNDHDYTRVTEFKHLTGQNHPGSSLVREYPGEGNDKYYPVPCPESSALFARYRELAAQEKQVTFLGRLGQYRYYNMDQAVGAALTAAHRLQGIKA